MINNTYIPIIEVCCQVNSYFCAVLMRSGIGPKADLESCGIECKVDLAGVGQNLIDHPVGFTIPLSVLQCKIS